MARHLHLRVHLHGQSIISKSSDLLLGTLTLAFTEQVKLGPAERIRHAICLAVGTAVAQMIVEYYTIRLQLLLLILDASIVALARATLARLELRRRHLNKMVRLLKWMNGVVVLYV